MRRPAEGKRRENVVSDECRLLEANERELKVKDGSGQWSKEG